MSSWGGISGRSCDRTDRGGVGASQMLPVVLNSSGIIGEHVPGELCLPGQVIRRLRMCTERIRVAYALKAICWLDSTSCPGAYRPPARLPSKPPGASLLRIPTADAVRRASRNHQPRLH
jgi:hypothetical protein